MAGLSYLTVTFVPARCLSNDREIVETLSSFVVRARNGDLDAFGQLVRQTQTMVFAVAVNVLRDAGLAQDAAQEAYLTAFRCLSELQEPAAFLAWLRRIAISVALNARRARRLTFLRLDDVPEVPVLDEDETSWTELQRRRLAGALLTLSTDERRMCDRRYHGQWSVGRLARDAGIDEAAMRKRLQRVRDKLRKEIEMSEQQGIKPDQIPANLPDRILELLARPQLTDLPEHPVGKVLDLLRTAFADFTERDLPEVLDFAEAERTIGRDALYLDPLELQRVDQGRILRYDLTLPLLLTLRFEGQPLRVFTSGKAYRACQLDATHLDAFHQAEVFCLDDRSRLDPWRMMGAVLRSVDVTLPGRAVKLVPTSYPMCSQAWDLEVEDHGRWSEVTAFGVFTDKVVAHLGADPRTHVAIGAGYGLERLAMTRYGIDDIRKVDVSRVA
jgi:RNA polymerase sigma factor (sigma-70 family)